MRGVVMYAAGDVRVEDRPEPTIVEPTDAILQLSATCICGSDLWPDRGADPISQPSPIGHEYVGIVEEVGSAVTTIRPGQFVIGSFTASDNTCEICRAGYQTSCLHGQPGARDGAQAQHADGHDARPGLGREVEATCAGCGCRWPTEPWSPPRGARRRSRPGLPGRLGRVGDRLFAAVAVEASPGRTVADSTRPGGHVGYVGVTHDVALPGDELFFSHVHLHGGPAPMRQFLPDLIDRIWSGQIRPGGCSTSSCHSIRRPTATGPWTPDRPSRSCSAPDELPTPRTKAHIVPQPLWCF